MGGGGEYLNHTSIFKCARYLTCYSVISWLVLQRNIGISLLPCMYTTSMNPCNLYKWKWEWCLLPYCSPLIWWTLFHTCSMCESSLQSSSLGYAKITRNVWWKWVCKLAVFCFRAFLHFGLTSRNGPLCTFCHISRTISNMMTSFPDQGNGRIFLSLFCGILTNTCHQGFSQDFRIGCQKIQIWGELDVQFLFIPLHTQTRLMRLRTVDGYASNITQ